MPAHRSTPKGRPHVLAAKLSDAENAFVERQRGPLARSEYLRLLLVRERKRLEG